MCSSTNKEVHVITRLLTTPLDSHLSEELLFSSDLLEGEIGYWFWNVISLSRTCWFVFFLPSTLSISSRSNHFSTAYTALWFCAGAISPSLFFISAWYFQYALAQLKFMVHMQYHGLWNLKILIHVYCLNAHILWFILILFSSTLSRTKYMQLGIGWGFYLDKHLGL